MILYYFSIAILGLLVGSFLNVVIYRLPIILKKQWQIQCQHLLNSPPQPEVAQYHSLNLFLPRSLCPHCRHTIGVLENIPLFSYLFLSGKCAHCGKKISVRYPLVEIISCCASIIVFWNFGLSWQTFFALIFTWSLICLAVIDLEQQILPDHITLPLLWLGLLLNLYPLFIPIQSAILGVVIGYLLLWFFYWGFKFLTGKDGMGYGDFKLLACCGAWMGWQSLPLVIFLSSVLGALVGIFLLVFRHHDRNVPIPFGPFLAFAGWISLIWGPFITEWYLNII